MKTESLPDGYPAFHGMDIITLTLHWHYCH